MNFWLGVLIFIGAVLVVPLAIRYGLKAFVTLVGTAAVGAFIGWLLDLAFGTFPKLAIAGVVVGVVALIGSTLEVWGGTADE